MAYVFGGPKYGRGVAAAMGLAACSLLGGCISTDSVSSTLGLNSPYEQVKGKFKTTAEARLTEKPRRTKTARSGTVLSFSGEPHHLTAMQAGEDLGLIRHARAEAYMRRILNKLAAQWPYEAPKVGVFVQLAKSVGTPPTRLPRRRSMT